MAFYITQYSPKLDLLGCSQESKLDPSLYGEGIAGIDEHTWDMWFPEKYPCWHVYTLAPSPEDARKAARVMVDTKIKDIFNKSGYAELLCC